MIIRHFPVLALFLFAQLHAQEVNLQKLGASISFKNVTTGSGKVEKVFRYSDGEYISISYLTTWNGQKLIVSDYTRLKEYREGDEIRFGLQKQDIQNAKSKINPVKSIFAVLI